MTAQVQKTLDLTFGTYNLDWDLEFGLGLVNISLFLIMMETNTFFSSLIPGIKQHYRLKLLTIGYETMVGFADGEETNRNEAILNCF